MSTKPLGSLIISIFLFLMSFITILGSYLSYLMPMLSWTEKSLQTYFFLYYAFSPSVLNLWILSYLTQLPKTTQALATMILLFFLGAGLFVSSIGFYKLKKWAYIFTVAYALYNIVIPFIPPTLNLNVLYTLASLTTSTILIQICQVLPAFIGFTLLLYLPGEIRKRFE
ncbi:MAG: hypothetical protein ACUVXA_15115 [Candidatus Jordarchaeum sp.]|uniref:hypothetical protein n=1 Tax=Candidatus Jordarchaeum sp. TaxID=2823881 RepID=UPI004049385B